MLGTGNFLAPPGRYWNSFLVSGEGTRVLFEPSPTALPSLRRAGVSAAELDAVVISHFHPDHTFGWPFLLLELLEAGGTKPISVVGPKGVASFLEEMMRLGSVLDLQRRAEASLGLSYVEIEVSSEGLSPVATPFHLAAVEVDHVPELRCLGYVIELDGHRLGYSGDTRPCAGLDALAARCDTLIVECNGVHATKSHMDVEAVRSLAARFEAVRVIATHLGHDVEEAMLEGVELPEDLATLTL